MEEASDQISSIFIANTILTALFIVNFFCESTTLYKNFVTSNFYKKNYDNIYNYCNFISAKYYGNVKVTKDGSHECLINKKDK